MANLSDDLLQQLLRLVDQLREESANFDQEHQDQQQWYNRGYANGVIAALIEIAKPESFAPYSVDDPSLLIGNEVMTWGKAYRHGEEMGRKETYEISGI